MHTVTGELRKDTRTFSGNNNNGQYEGFSIELSEVIYDRKSGTKEYTNYRAVFFATTEKMANYLRELLVPGRTVSIAAAKLKVKTFQSTSGETHINLEMIEPRIDWSSFNVNNTTNAGQSGGNNSGWGQPQQPPKQNNQNNGNQNQNSNGGQQNQPNDFDDDIPF